eukprot:jgi/Ulvmu1/907/UM101_0015.1
MASGTETSTGQGHFGVTTAHVLGVVAGCHKLFPAWLRMYDKCVFKQNGAVAGPDPSAIHNVASADGSKTAIQLMGQHHVDNKQTTQAANCGELWEPMQGKLPPSVSNPPQTDHDVSDATVRSAASSGKDASRIVSIAPTASPRGTSLCRSGCRGQACAIPRSQADHQAECQVAHNKHIPAALLKEDTQDAHRISTGFFNISAVILVEENRRLRFPEPETADELLLSTCVKEGCLSDLSDQPCLACDQSRASASLALQYPPSTTRQCKSAGKDQSLSIAPGEKVSSHAHSKRACSCPAVQAASATPALVSSSVRNEAQEPDQEAELPCSSKSCHDRSLTMQSKQHVTRCPTIALS